MMKTISDFLISIFAAFFVFTSFCHTAFAEPVLIHSRSGQDGHGWLFGAPQDGQCWIVAPAHVVASPETGELEPFYFVDSRGVSGESAKPISGVASDNETLTNKEGQDLAFGRVAIGRPDGECRSRLGLPTMGYQAAMLAAHDFVVISQFQTSASGLPLTLARHSVDSFGGAVIDFRPSGAIPPGSLRKGISGSPVLTEIGGQSVPVAMVLRINSDTGVLRTLRFDYIKEQFNKLWAEKRNTSTPQASMDGMPYRIQYTSYAPVDGDLGASSLLQGNGCWAARAPEGKQTAELVIAVGGRGTIRGIEIFQNETCGSGPLHFWVDQRIREDATWEYVKAYEHRDQKHAVHRIELSSPRQLRIRFEAKRPIFIQGIRLR